MFSLNPMPASTRCRHASFWRVVEVDAERRHRPRLPAVHLREAWSMETVSMKPRVTSGPDGHARSRRGGSRPGRPDAPAFVDGDHRTTWAEYDARSDALAATLVAAGNAPGDRIAVMLPDGPAVHAAFLAIEKAGGVIVGIGPRAGEREVEHLLGKTGAAALLSTTDAAPVAARLGHRAPRGRRDELRRDHTTVGHCGRRAGSTSRSAALAASRSRRPLAAQLDVGDDRAPEVRDARPAPVVRVPRPRGPGRRALAPTTSS